MLRDLVTLICMLVLLKNLFLNNSPAQNTKFLDATFIIVLVLHPAAYLT